LMQLSMLQEVGVHDTLITKLLAPLGCTKFCTSPARVRLLGAAERKKSSPAGDKYSVVGCSQ